MIVHARERPAVKDGVKLTLSCAGTVTVIGTKSMTLTKKTAILA